LLARILDCHSRIAVYHESHYYPLFRPLLHLYGDLHRSANLTRLIADLCEVTRFQGFMDPPPVAEFVSALNEPSFEGVFATLLQLHARQQGKIRGADKTPEHHRYLAEIIEKFPGSPVIFLLRDPRDTVLSIRKALGTSLAGAVRMWRSAYDSYCRFANRVHRVRYEDLVSQPEKIAKEICALLDEPFEPEMFRYSDRIPKSLAARPNFSKLLKRVDSASVGSFREMAARDIQWIEAVCRDGMEALGYPFVAKRPQCIRLSAPSRMEFVFDRLRYYGFDRKRWRRGWMRWKIALRLRARHVFS
jgi:hypothetical protein